MKYMARARTPEGSPIHEASYEINASLQISFPEFQQLVMRCIVVMTGPSSVKRVMTRGSPVKFGCATPVAHPSSDTLKSKVTRTPTTLPMKPTSNNAKEPICRKRFGVLVPFVFSGMNKAGSALCAIPKSLGSRVGAFTTAFPA